MGKYNLIPRRLLKKPVCPRRWRVTWSDMQTQHTWNKTSKHGEIFSELNCRKTKANKPGRQFQFRCVAWRRCCHVSGTESRDLPTTHQDFITQLFHSHCTASHNQSQLYISIFNHTDDVWQQRLQSVLRSLAHLQWTPIPKLAMQHMRYNTGLGKWTFPSLCQTNGCAPHTACHPSRVR